MANYNLVQLQQLSREAGWAEHLIAKAAAIWKYESNGNPNAHNPNGENSWGLAQINLPFHPTMNVAKATDPLTALRYAYKLYLNRPDWGDWYNSNKKYNNNYQGIAEESRRIYNQGIQNTASVLPIYQATEPLAVVNVPFEGNLNDVEAIKWIGGLVLGILVLRVLRG